MTIDELRHVITVKYGDNPDALKELEACIGDNLFAYYAAAIAAARKKINAAIERTGHNCAMVGISLELISVVNDVELINRITADVVAHMEENDG